MSFAKRSVSTAQQASCDASQNGFASNGFASLRKAALGLAPLALIAALGVSGCGSGGYPSGGVMSLSETSIVLDAGQSMDIAATTAGNVDVAWSFVGSACSASACGSLSATRGPQTSFTAPAGIATSITFNIAASVPGTKNQQTVLVTVNPDPKVGGELPDGMVGVNYSTKIAASGGTTATTLSIASGALPAGLSFSPSTGLISGTPATAGTFTFGVQLKDSSMVPLTVTASETITIATSQLAITSSLPGGTVGTPYSSTITASGGNAPYKCSISGALPQGLSLNGCILSGTPVVAGSFAPVVTVTDASSPAHSASATQTVVISGGPLTLATSPLPGGTVGIVYNATIGVSGGIAPYSCSITAGTLPAGLTLSACVISGTPTAAGTSPLTVKITDSSKPAQTISGSKSITIAPAALALSGMLPNGTIGVPYSSTLSASGGTAPYTCSITGTLPAGLILHGCVVSGTPTIAGSFTVTVKITDAGIPAQSVSASETIVINHDPLSLTASPLPNGFVLIPYVATIGIDGGTAPYTCAITAGKLPAGLNLNGCIVTGLPITSGSSTFTVKVTDSSKPALTISGLESITIDAATLTITDQLPGGTAGVPYSSIITATGGTSPYACSITGTLPAGLHLNGCTVSGTPTTPGPSIVTITVTDSSKPKKSGSSLQTIVIAPSSSLSLTANLPPATIGTAYSYTLLPTGGTPTYSFAISEGSLPPGLTLLSNGVISGTPTTPGATSFTVTVTDSASPSASVSVMVTLLVRYAHTAHDAELTGPYAFLFQGYDDVLAGVLAYKTASVGSFTADGSGGINSGELDANHQSSDPDDTTIASQLFLGTYAINADHRGLITITTLNDNGTTDKTTTYAVSLKAPVAPATASTHASVIEFDDDQLVGTKGSGTLLAQTPSQFSNALNGSFAFGLSGDTPCLISCTVGVASGPVAAVGQFTTNGSGTLTSGVSDVNVATVNLANAPLTGSYEPADSNGRIQLEMTNTSISDGLYPTNFAVYAVNANEVFIMSTDKHSAYDLLAGTAQLQSSTSFTDAAMNGPIVGYENAQMNPGLLGTTLQGVLNLSSATVFRASGDGSGTCNTTNVDSGGLTSLVGSLTSLGNTNQNNLLGALLGSYGATGKSACAVSSNGRGKLDYPNHPSLVSLLLQVLGLPAGPPSARVFYLTSPGTGYFLETGYAGLGQFEAQSGAPFTLATLKGTFVDQGVPASSLAGINQSGYLTADGDGNLTYTEDENIGIGTLNVLDLGVSGSTTYGLLDSNANVAPSAAGRYVLADTTTVIYEISPGRFVMVDTNPTTTSPSISLLY
jgi:hypothetical protein